MKMSRYIYLTVVVFISSFIYTSCMFNTPDATGGPKISIAHPENAVIDSAVNISIHTLEPGIKNLKLSVNSKDDSNVFILKEYPYAVSWNPKLPGIYTLKAEGFSINDGRWYSATSTITVYDKVPPYIEEIKLIPEKPYIGDQVLLQIKLDGRNPVVGVELAGRFSSSSNWVYQTVKTSDQYVYLMLPQLNNVGKVELFLRSVAYRNEDATKVTFDVKARDLTSPNISVYAQTFYPENSNISVRVELSDNVELKRYKMTFDNEVIFEEEISGKSFTKEVLIGKKDLGTHTINVVAFDSEGNMNTYAKKIYVGGTALSFNAQVSPSEPTANSTAVIAMVPDEKDVIYTRVAFFVDGNAIADYRSEGENSAQSFALWDVEEGNHVITIYAESKDKRAGIAETLVNVKDYNGPRFISLKANGVELKKGVDNYVFPGLVTFQVTVYDPGGINLTVLPRLLIKEDEFTTFYRDLEMQIDDVSPDGRIVTFSVTTTMVLGYYYVTVMNVQDKSGNAMKDVGKFLLYVQ
ncbi:MAG: hypothetical protein ACP5PP_02360 [Fervidobacterium sp.]